MNEKVRKLLVEGVALRGIARTLKLSRKSVARKLLFLSFKAEKKDKEIKKTQLPCQIVEFDDLETCEGSKYRPLSVVLAVEHRRSRILGFKIASMPSKGRLSPDKKAKYLPREDERSSMRKKLFSEIRPLLHPMAVIKSDQNPHYRNDVRTYFPNSQHITFRGRKPAFTGQGEMKEGGFDPLFSLNHTFAMMRARMSRLIRKTWSISKKKENLRLHMNIYVAHHNQQLLDREVKKAGQSRSA